MRLRLTLFGIWTMTFLVAAQPEPLRLSPHFIHINTPDGLGGSEVYDMEQDDEGYLWFATDDGLVKFDGYQFTTFTTAHGLPENVILSLYKDNQGRIWLTFLSKGFGFWYQNNFTRFSHQDILSSHKPLPGTDYYLLNQDASKVFAALTGRGILEIDCPTGDSRVHQTRNKEAINIFNVGNNFLLNHGSHFAAPFDLSVSRALVYMDGSGKQENTGIKLRPGEFAISTCAMNGDEYLFFSSNRIMWFNRAKLVREVAFQGGNLLKAYYQPDKSIWLCLRGGLGLRVFENFDALSTGKYQEYLPGESISSVFFDRWQNLWVTSLNNGVYLAVHPEVQVVQLPNLKGHLLKIETNDKDEVYLGSDQFELYQINKSKQFIKALIPKIHGKTLYDLLWLEDQKRLLVGNQLIEVDKNQVVGTLTGSPEITWPRHYHLSADRQKVWVITGNIIRNYDIITHKQKYSPKDDLIPRVIDLQETPDHTLWLGTVDGLMSLNLSSDLLSSHTHLHPVLSERIEKLAIKSDSTLVVASKSQGVLLWKDTSFIHLTTQHGLLSNTIDALFIDKLDNIWVGSKSGLNCIHTRKPMKIESYTISSGLPSNQITDIDQLGNELWVATTNGLTIFSPYWRVRTITQPVILAFKSQRHSKTLSSQSIHLDAGENDIEISFHSIYPHLLGNIKYRYRLNDNEQWQETKSTTLRLSKLQFGEYHFEVQAFGEDDSWSPSTGVRFRVRRPFYLSPWFFLLSLAILSLIIFTVARYYIKRARRKAHFEKQIFELERRALQAQMNPHFIFNALNSIQLLIAKSDTKSAMYFLSSFASLVRRILDNSAKSEVRLSEEIEMLKQYIGLEKLRKKDQLQYEVMITPEVMTDEIYLPPMLVQPIVENAIKHGIEPLQDRPGKVEIIFDRDSDFLYITINDNGIGLQRRPNQTLEPHGYQLVAKRIGLWNSASSSKSIDILTRPDFDGTSIRLKVAIKQS